jgi:hypothetical protein
VIDRKIRIYKDSFTKWLDSQDKHSIIIGKEDE